MPWVPIHESGLPFVFTADGIAAMAGSVVSYSSTSLDRPNSGWNIALETPALVRVTAQSYLTSANRSGQAYWPSSFAWDFGEEQVNEAPPYPDGAYPDNSPVSAFSPSPLEIEGTISSLSYLSTRTSGDQYVDDEDYAFLIEVFSDTPAALDKPYVVRNTWRAYQGATTELSCWIRGENGKIDLTLYESLEVHVSRGQNRLLRLDATGDTEGQLTFQVTNRNIENRLSLLGSFRVTVIGDDEVIATGLLEVI